MDVRALPLGKLRAAEWNANRPGPELIRKLRRSIEQFGLVSNLVVRKHPTRRGAFEVLSGNHRLELLLELGFEEAPVVVVDVDDTQARLLAVTLNRGGENDPIAYAQLISDVIGSLGSTTELEELLPETPDTIEAALARLEALPQPAPLAGLYPLIETWKLGFKLEAALACRRRERAIVGGDDAEALVWWYGHVFDQADVVGDNYFGDLVDVDDTGVELERVFRGGGEFVLSMTGTSKRSMSAKVRAAAKNVGGELEVLSIDEHDELVFGAWRSTS